MNWTAIGAIAATLTLGYLVWKDWPDIKGRLLKGESKPTYPPSKRTFLVKVGDAIIMVIIGAIIGTIYGVVGGVMVGVSIVAKGGAIVVAVVVAVGVAILGAFLGAVGVAFLGAIGG